MENGERTAPTIRNLGKAMNDERIYTAAVVVIGNEVLSGRVQARSCTGSERRQSVS